MPPTDHASDVLSGEGVAAAAAGSTDMDEVTVEREDIAEATAAASADDAVLQGAGVHEAAASADDAVLQGAGGHEAGAQRVGLAEGGVEQAAAETAAVAADPTAAGTVGAVAAGLSTTATTARGAAGDAGGGGAGCVQGGGAQVREVDLASVGRAEVAAAAAGAGGGGDGSWVGGDAVGGERRGLEGNFRKSGVW